MRKRIYIITISFLTLLFSCNSENKQIVKEEIFLKKGDTITKVIELKFNKDAIDNRESLTFEINEDFDFDNFILLYNEIETTNTIYRVTAEKEEQTLTFKYFLKDDASPGDYNFSINLVDQSIKIEDVIYDGQPGFIETEINVPKSNMEVILSYLKYILLFLALLAVIYFLLKRDNMPLGKRTFKSGIISYPDSQLTLRLEDVYRYGLDISKALDIDSGINLVPQDRYYNKKKRRFARLKNSSSAEISIIYDEFEDTIGGSQDLFHMDEIKIKTENKTFILNYINRNNIRIS